MSTLSELGEDHRSEHNHIFEFSEDSSLAASDVIDEMMRYFQCNDPTVAAMIQSDLFRLMVRGQTKEQAQQTAMKLMHLLYRRLLQNGVSRLEIWKKVCLAEWI